MLLIQVTLRKKAFASSGEHGDDVDPTEVMPRSALHSVSTLGNYSKYSECHNQGKDLDIDGSANNTIYFTSSSAARPYSQPHNVDYQQSSVQPPILSARKAFAQTSPAKDGDITSPPEPSDSGVFSMVKGNNDM
jgi:hypothetical protein